MQKIKCITQLAKGQTIKIDLMDGSALEPHYEEMKVEEVAPSFVKLRPVADENRPVWQPTFKIRKAINQERVMICQL